MAYGARLESGLGVIPQGFKSLILRRINSSRQAIVNLFQKETSVPSYPEICSKAKQSGRIQKAIGRTIHLFEIETLSKKPCE